MAAARGARDQELLDTVDAFPRSPFDDTVWRIVRAGRDPLRPAAARGRWDDSTFEVLYTSAEADGARAEVFFHLDRGQPVFPTNIAFHLFELHLRLGQGLGSANIESLPQVGIDPASFGSLGYVRLGDEYSRSQQVAEAAHFPRL